MTAAFADDETGVVHSSVGEDQPAAVCVGLVLWMRSRKSPDSILPLVIFGFAVIGFNPKQMTREQAKHKAEELQDISDELLPELAYIYGEPSLCSINKLILDTDFYKAAEWRRFHARVLWVNPLRPAHRAHFAEELHNRFRADIYGDAHRYLPRDEADRIRREKAQAVCRKF